MSESVLPMFSSRSFIVSDLTFRSLIHFEFIFVLEDSNDDPVCKTGKETQMCIADFWTQRERERVG